MQGCGWLALPFVLLVSVPACTEPALETAAFGQDIVQRIHSRYPEAKVGIVDELSATISFAGTEPVTMNFDRIFAFCKSAEAADCEGQKQKFVESVRDATTTPEITRESLRLIVRGSDYLTELARLGRPDNPPPIQRPISEGIGMVLMADFPRTARTVSSGDLKKLKLAEEDALRLAREQVVSRLPEVPNASELATGKLLAIEAEYAESLLLKAESWKKLNAETRGMLLVAVPGANLLLVGMGTDTEAMPLAQVVASLTAESPRPISPYLYRWRNGAWSVILKQ
jgi:hypothetical protein